MEKQKFIEKLLFDYDLIETDKNCMHNISGALLEATQYEQKKNESRKLIVKHL